MNILLVEPSGYVRINQNLPVRASPFPSVGLGSLAAVLKRESGFSVFGLDVSHETKNTIASILNKPYHCILITATTFTYRDALALALDIKSKSAIPLGIGGPHVTLVGKEVFSDGVWDGACVGEAEETIVQFVKSLTDKDVSIRSVTWPIGTKSAQVNRIQSLDSLPHPDYSIFNAARYEYYPIITSRGCPYSCTFCAASALWGKHFAQRKVDSIINEMDTLVSTYGKKPFHINDDNFTLKKQRVIELCKKLISGKRNYTWVAQGVRADTVNPQLLRLMKKAGCERISMGVESASPAVLLALGKNEKIDEIQKGIWAARDAGIDVLAMFIIGSHADTLEHVQKSFAFVKKNVLFPVDFYQLIPYPGTAEWEHAHKSGTFLVNNIREFDHYSSEVVLETEIFKKPQREKALAQAAKLIKEMEKKWRWYKHVRFFMPQVIIHKHPLDIISEMWLIMRLVLGKIKRIIAIRK